MDQIKRSNKRGCALQTVKERTTERLRDPYVTVYITLAKAPPRVHAESRCLRRRSLVFTEAARFCVCACASSQGPPNGPQAAHGRMLP